MVVNFRVCFLDLIVISSMLIPGMRFDQTDDDVCWGPECDKLAQEVRANILSTEHPCTDFYEYACGNWVNNHPLPTPDASQSVLDLMLKEIYRRLSGLLSMKVLDSDSEVIKKSKKFYAACMNIRKIKTDAVQRLRARMDLAGGWPMIYPPDKFDQTMHWEHIHSYFARLTGTGALFNINVKQHYVHKSQYAIYIDQPYGAFGIIESITNPSTFDTYKTVMKEVAKIFATDAGNTIPDEAIEKDLDDVITFRKALQQALKTGAARFQLVNSDFTIEGLQRATPQATDTQVGTDWLNLIQRTFSEIPNADIKDNTVIVLRAENYILAAPHEILKTSLRVLANHIHMYFLEKHMEYLPDPILTLLDNFYKDVTGVTKPHMERWHECLMSHPMQHAISSLYVIWHFPQSERNKVNVIANDIKAAMKERITNAQWLEDSTKQEALLKVDTMEIMIGSPDWYRMSNSSKLMEYYKGQKVGSNYIQNILDYEEREYKIELGFYTGESTRETIEEYPIQPNAYYRNSNTMVISVGQTISPFYHYKFPPVVNYAGLGTVFSHEMTHGFDKIGGLFDHEGKRRNWWTPNTVKEYNTKLNCFVNQYSSFGYKELEAVHPTWRVDGVKTFNENLADTIGLQVAYQAYKKKMEKDVPKKRVSSLSNVDNERVFFLIYANTFCEHESVAKLERRLPTDPHTTPRLRVNVPVSNMPEFSSAFGCNPGTPMNPATKCTFW